jgi:hypothetical protein
MGCDGFGNATEAASLLARIFHRVFGDMPARLIAWKEPVLRFFQAPPVTQSEQQLRREHHVAIFSPFALFDS